MYNKLYSSFKQFIKENIFLIIFTIVIIAILNINLPFFVEAPGGLIGLKDKIVINNKNNNIGDINLSYVSVYDGNFTTFILSKINKNWDIVPVDDYILKGENKKDSNNRNKILLDNSLSNAYYVAFTSLNKKINIVDSEIYVIGVLSNNSNLKIGDKINNIDNKKFNSTKEISDYVLKKKPNDKLLVNVNDNVEKYAVVNSDNKLEIILATNYNYNKDIKFNFKKGESGPSGGAMIALSIYNAYNKDDITRGMKIAGTGTISKDGKIGEISGVKYKLLGAKNVDLFFLPEANYEEAKELIQKYDLNIKIVPVSTFDDLLNYLKNYS